MLKYALITLDYSPIPCIMKPVFLSICLLLTLSVIGQDQQAFKPSQFPIANPLLIQQFQGSRCLDTLSWEEAEPTPTWLRIPLKGYYEPLSSYPFITFYQPPSTQADQLVANAGSASLVEGQPLYFLNKGICRGIHVSIPLEWPGSYYITILDQEQPSLIRVQTDLVHTSIQFLHACPLHQ